MATKNTLKIKYNKAKQILVIVLVSLVSVGCIANRSKDRILVAGAGKIISIDPAQASTFQALQIISALGDPLYRVNKGGALVPVLARELPSISQDKLTVIIKLREDVVFHDGTTFDANAMVFSIQRFIDIGTLNYVLGDRISSVESEDKFTLRINLTRPSSSLNGLLTSIHLTPVSPSSYANYKDKFLNDNFVGTGPYRITSFQNGHQRLEPFTLYWGDRPKNEGIDFISLSNSTALYGSIKSKEVDVLLSDSIDEDQRRSLNEMTKEGLLKEGIGPAMEIGYITLLTNKEPFSNPIIREAIAYSINRSLISERVSYGLREPLYSIIPPSLKNESPGPWPEYNAEHARSLMTSQGYCSNRKLNIPLTYRSNIPADKLLALTWQSQIKSDLSDCFVIKLDGIESTTVYRQLSKGVFPAVILDWRGSYPDPEAYLTPFLSCSEIEGQTCNSGEAVASGSFWGSQDIQSDLQESEYIEGDKRLQMLLNIEVNASKAFAYIPIWVVKPRAWVQNNIESPEFDGSGQLLLQRLSFVKSEK